MLLGYSIICFIGRVFHVNNILFKYLNSKIVLLNVNSQFN